MKNTPSINPWLLLWIILLLAKGLAVTGVAALPRSPDELTYHIMGKSLAMGEGLRYDGKTTAMVVPVYPMMVSLCYRLFGVRPSPIYWMQLALTLALSLAYGRLLVRLTGREAWGRWCAILIFVFPPYIYYAGFGLTEIAFSTFLAFSFLFFDRTLRRPESLRDWLGLSLFHTLGFMTRPVTFLITPVIWLWPMAAGKFRPRVWLGAFLAGLLLMCVWLPWVGRNYRVFGRFVPLSNYSGYTLIGAGLDDMGQFYVEAERVLKAAGIRHFFEDEYRSNQVLCQAAKERIRSDYPGYLMRSIKRSWKLWLYEYAHYFGLTHRFFECWRQKRFFELAGKIVLLGINLLVPAAFLISLWVLRRRRDCWPYLLFLLYFTAMHALLMPVSRYGVPAAGLTIVLAFASADQWMREAKQDSNPPPQSDPASQSHEQI